MPIACTLRPRKYALTPIAATGDRFTNFAPYVPAINDAGAIAFQAALATGGSGAFIEHNGAISTVCDPASLPISEVTSHPDLNATNTCCFYAKLDTGRAAVVHVHHGSMSIIADSPGPLGPTINSRADIAFRTVSPDGHAGILIAQGNSTTLIADTRAHFRAFHGLPVINDTGAVAFRADTSDGRQVICVFQGGVLQTVARTTEDSSSLGAFPTLNDDGVVAFCATHHAVSTLRAARGTSSIDLLDSSGPFESFRGVLLDSSGRVVFYATPRAGRLGIFTGPDPRTDRLLSLGDPFLDSTIADFALNPVSINRAGHLAIRVALADGRQYILRADPLET